MSRIPLVDDALLTEDLRRYQRENPEGKMAVFGLIAQSPTCALPYLGFMKTTFAQLALSSTERELIVLAVSHLEDARYEWLQHVEVARSIDMPDEKVEAIAGGFPEQGPFTAKEWALLDFTRATVRNVRVDDAVFGEMARHFSPREIVEAILTIGGYMTLGRLTEIAEVREDKILGPDAFHAAVAAAKA